VPVNVLRSLPLTTEPNIDRPRSPAQDETRHPFFLLSVLRPRLLSPLSAWEKQLIYGRSITCNGSQYHSVPTNLLLQRQLPIHIQFLRLVQGNHALTLTQSVSSDFALLPSPHAQY
jgi:hypothetical protein